MKVQEVALQLGVGLGTVETWIRNGELAITVDAKGRRGITDTALKAFWDSRSNSQDNDSGLRKKLGPETDALLIPENIGFIYFLLFCGDVVYVGSSEGGFGTRMSRHRRNGMVFNTSRLLMVPLRGLALRREENRYIAMFKPKYNRRGWDRDPMTRDERLRLTTLAMSTSDRP